jgi:hypothetical protein
MTICDMPAVSTPPDAGSVVTRMALIVSYQRHETPTLDVVIAGLDPISANIRLRIGVNDPILRDAPFGRSSG